MGNFEKAIESVNEKVNSLIEKLKSGEKKPEEVIFALRKIVLGLTLNLYGLSQGEQVEYLKEAKSIINQAIEEVKKVE